MYNSMLHTFITVIDHGSFSKAGKSSEPKIDGTNSGRHTCNIGRGSHLSGCKVYD